MQHPIHTLASPRQVDAAAAGRRRTAPARSWRLQRALPVLVVALAAWQAAAFALATPAWEAPDEPWHLVYAERLAAGRVPEAQDTYEAHHPPGAYLWLAAWQRALGWPALQRSPYEARFPLAPNAYLHEVESEATERRLRLLRALGSFLALPGLALLHAAARRAGLARRTIAYALLATMLPPVFPATLATVNNDGAAFLAGAAMLYAALRLAIPRPHPPPAAGGGRLRDAGVLGLALTLAALSKLNVLPLLLAVVVAPLAHFGARRDRQKVTAGFASLVGGVGIAALCLGLITLLPLMSVVVRLPAQILDRGGGGALWRTGLGSDAWRVIDSSLGSFGWQNLQLAPGHRLSALASLGLMTALGLGRLWRRGSQGHRQGPPLATLLLLSMAALFGSLLANGAAEPAALQGRLLLPALPAWALLAGLGLDSAHRALGGARSLRLLLLLPPVSAQLVALLLLLPQARGDAGRPSGILLRRTVAQDLRPDLSLGPGEQREEQLRARVPLLLERLELPVLASSGDGRLQLSLSLRDGAAVAVAMTEGRLGAMGRASVEAAPHTGPLADSHWLGFTFDPPLAVPQGATLTVRISLAAASEEARTADKAGGVPPGWRKGLLGTGRWQRSPEARLWTAALEDQPEAAFELLEPSGAGDPDRATVWIGYGVAAESTGDG